MYCLAVKMAVNQSSVNRVVRAPQTGLRDSSCFPFVFAKEIIQRFYLKKSF